MMSMRSNNQVQHLDLIEQVVMLDLKINHNLMHLSNSIRKPSTKDSKKEHKKYSIQYSNEAKVGSKVLNPK